MGKGVSLTYVFGRHLRAVFNIVQRVFYSPDTILGKMVAVINHGVSYQVIMESAGLRDKLQWIQEYS